LRSITKSSMKKEKKAYSGIGLQFLSVVPVTSILGGSIVDNTTTVTIPRGQKVDEFDFSSDEFSHEWEVSDPI